MCLHAEKMVAADDNFPGNLEKLESDEGTGLDKMDEHNKDCVAKKMKNGRILCLLVCSPLEKKLSIIFMLG